MTDQQFAQIVNLCKRIDSNLAKVRTDLKQLTAIQGATTAELNMLKERFDIHQNQEFIAESRKPK